MDPLEPQESPSADNTGKSEPVVLRSATPSESSPSKPLPDAEAVVLPEWQGNQAVASWFLQFQKCLKSIIYSYVHYESLSRFLRELWVRWKEFSDTKSITTTFLSSSVIYDDFLQPISWMTTPRNAARRFAEEMAQLRNTMREVASELFVNRTLIQDAMARLEETNNGHHVAPFCGLPTPDESDDAAEKLEKFLLTDPDHESLPSEDEDTDTDEVPVIYSREMKDPNLLEENWLDPIWVEGYGYPGTVPREIEEYLEFDCADLYSMIGSIRSIFWLFNHRELVKVIDDPACILEDEISFHVAPAFHIPDAVTSEPSRLCIADMYRFSRRQAFPETVLCLKIKCQKNKDRTLAQVKKKLDETCNIDGDKLWFRGLSMVALTLSMSFFIPVISTGSPDNEFGPGIYTTNTFRLAVEYARPSGAVMVFKDPDLRDLNVWKPDLSEWQHLTAHWLQIPINGLKAPDNYKDADIIIGPLSVKQSEAKAKKRFPDQGEQLQLVCTSYESCKRLAASLAAIIYFTP
ncbi:uncharacterized protein NFIA_010950 [Aspergillus fischeri NRRL 181]|uniref:Uncharacterized protein n=1 Tax=Neosartorya fischeri (strain ATCC 1020 / DSM 3700 / CBS 544.65 / FGSC A1164 / JCM 1740 / NRRL 181 / WB 181) TaxID=331117 RepID=A1D1X0_NEOFI|nr:uncharacterized protein NFIA_010950 [Aspergillus fischeri NRRL 181]EAW22413.1 hypothetical protein NFIA_010950 [Aspergillus fischeri NRRL 181]